jgi:uncharacterized membrane protein YhaH (DUF805 family)
MTSTTMWTGITRRLGLDHNPLRRRTDLIGAWLAPAVVVAFLFLAPLVGGLVGLRVQADNTAAQRDQSSWHSVPAVLLQAVPGPMMTDNGANSWLTWTRARWTSGGLTHVGQILATSGTSAGTTVRVWLNRAGAVQGPPLTATGARQRIVVAVSFVLAALAVLLISLALAVRRLLDRRRLRSWEADWLLVGPQWSHHG